MATERVGDVPGEESDGPKEPWLVVVSGDCIGDAVALEIGVTAVLGGDKALPMSVGDPSVSRRHVEIMATSPSVAYVRDLDSQHGVFVNGRRVSAATIGPDDRLQFGTGTVVRLTPRARETVRKGFKTDQVTTKMVVGGQLHTSREPGAGPEVVGCAPALLAALGVAEQVAKTDSSVLIVGETGTGKELLARTIHAASSRRTQPFVPVDLPSIPPTLLETTLFGHVKGAFTGADRGAGGLVEAAEGGTLFLDEIGDLDVHLQAKLLRLLQGRTYQKVGSTQRVNANFRLICATFHDLDKAVQEGKFRMDLLYRIDVVRVVTPPLRERASDIEALAKIFVARYCRRDGRNVLDLSREALEELQAHRWPGNVRELEHTMERAVALTPEGQVVGPGLVNWRGRRTSITALVDHDYTQNRSLEEVLADVEKRILADAMARFEGNRTAVAAKLKVPRTTLRHKLRKYGLD